MNKWVRWQDWAVVAAGAYAALSVMWTAQAGGSLLMLLILGVALAGSGLWSLAMPGLVSMEWAHIAIGALLLIAPWVGAFSTQTGVAWTSWICGAVGVIAGALAVQPARHMHEHPAGH
ncbi:SPW repeat protein [Lacisediminihabitans profunda]|uniref:SPW repeat-containing integral membrane domain-containing protein n=1 Tax=Lacisediminihabitans profunda TaxID=2594790 RepID=A0A5C8UUE7_9MICO|nr:SPW repeat protein [Lacisediminihabitans profunda]TXN32297.1 hypothetical protein FVP33_01315 [Lacisediminihabitans profunda]